MIRCLIHEKQNVHLVTHRPEPSKGTVSAIAAAAQAPIPAMQAAAGAINGVRTAAATREAIAKAGWPASNLVGQSVGPNFPYMRTPDASFPPCLLYIAEKQNYHITTLC